MDSLHTVALSFFSWKTKTVLYSGVNFMNTNVKFTCMKRFSPIVKKKILLFARCSMVFLLEGERNSAHTLTQQINQAKLEIFTENVSRFFLKKVP